MRKTKFYLGAVISVLAIVFVAARLQGVIHKRDFVAIHDSDSKLSVQEKETIRKTFSLNPSHRALTVDNVNGSIEVVGTSSDQVQMVVEETIKAESKEKVDQARKEVTLDTTQNDDGLRLYVNGPFRCHSEDDCRGHREHTGYSVRMDFQLQVPHDIALTLKTVNGGHVQVKDVNGAYSVHNVNGGVEMQDIAGSGHVKTVNGPVKVSFRENPKENSDFGTINGPVELQFARNLSADFRFKTMNGGVYSDFPMTALPAQEVQGERRNGRFVYRADRTTGGRIGSGGPEIKVENLNGDIRVLERHE